MDRVVVFDIETVPDLIAGRALMGEQAEGLDDAALARLGERGLRFDESTPGTGLGVSISRDIAESYGGELDFHRSALGGLQANLRLPVWRGG